MQPHRRSASAGTDVTFSMSYPAHPQSVANARAGVAGFAARAGVPATTLEVVKLAVSEAATNVVLHAYPAPNEDARIEVDAVVENGELVVSVADRGTGLRHRMDSPGLGLGLAIIGQLADKVEMLQGSNGGVRVLMRFAAAAAEAC